MSATNMTHTSGKKAEDKHPVSAADLKRAYEAGISARNLGRRRNPPHMSNASPDMALAWTCGWDACERVKEAAGRPWQHDDTGDLQTTVG